MREFLTKLEGFRFEITYLRKFHLLVVRYSELLQEQLKMFADMLQNLINLNSN